MTKANSVQQVLIGETKPSTNNKQSLNRLKSKGNPKSSSPASVESLKRLQDKFAK